MVVEVVDPGNVLEDHCKVSRGWLVNEPWIILFKYLFIELE